MDPRALERLDRATLPDRIRAARHRAGLSLQRLATDAGISMATLENLEHRRHAPKMSTIQVLALALQRAGVDIFSVDPALGKIEPRRKARADRRALVGAAVAGVAAA